ncbi:MAG: hypothetical protein WDA07_13075 [Leucobacter sp.]
MAKDLDVDTVGLRAASASSADVAAEVLTSGVGGGVAFSRASGAGAAAFDAACSSVHVRQAGRVAGHAEAMASAAAGYDAVDGGNAEIVSAVL